MSQEVIKLIPEGSISQVPDESLINAAKYVLNAHYDHLCLIRDKTLGIFEGVGEFVEILRKARIAKIQTTINGEVIRVIDLINKTAKIAA